MATVIARWTGKYPNLCHGEWRLTVDDVGYSELLANKGEMNTVGEYQRWYFDKNWSEHFESYTDGLDFSDWRKENLHWLSKITDNITVQEQIFEAIQKEDFRYGSCGGCI